MAVPESSVASKNNQKMKKKRENSDKELLLTVQEIKFSKYLAANDPKDRRRALKALPKWLAQRSKTKELIEDDFMLLWKGLFYNMWMSDKPLVQEQCAEDISHLIHLPNFDQSMLFFKAGFKTLINEWFGIDQLRLDKFLMFVRRLLRQAIVALNNNSFKKKNIEKMNAVLEETILNSEVDSVPIGLLMHFIEIYLEEVAKISEGNYHPELTTELVRPFIKKLAVTKDYRILNCIRKFIFLYLIQQHNLGLEYQTKYEIWRAQGFPGSIDSIQKVKVSDEETESENENSDDQTQKEEKPLDPRAGRVDVELPQLNFIPKSLAEALLSVKFNPETNVKSRGEITMLAEKFKKLGQGIYPLGTKRVYPKKRKNNDIDTNITKAAKKLIKFENKLLGKNKNKKRKRKDVESVDIIPEKKVKQNSIEEPKIEKTFVNDENETSKKKKNAINGTNIPHKLKRIEKKKHKKQNISENKKEILKNLANDPDNLEYVFERNSGVWYVYVNDEEKGKNKGAKKIAISPNSSWQKSNNESTDKEVVNGSSKIGLQPVALFNSPNSRKTPEKSLEIFGKPPDWDDDLKQGEYEFFVHSRKYLDKMKKKKSESLEDLISKIRGKSRNSSAEFLTPKPASAKKVRINMKLNRAQEIDEHFNQIRMSPHNPYDSSKKPGKPLLKTPLKMSPVNPFYRTRLSF